MLGFGSFEKMTCLSSDVRAKKGLGEGTCTGGESGGRSWLSIIDTEALRNFQQHDDLT